ncbi:MAG: hypothetical protein K0Q90_914 [Paenibacillaceae bacterium]|nr:hypothetical protein [Paenibacillaceae bacterium]
MEPFVQHIADNGVELYRLEGWLSRFPGLSAGFTGRSGGNGRAPYASLNLGLHVDDEPAVVVDNRRLLAGALGTPLEVWTYGEQVHGARVQLVEAVHKGRGTLARADAFPEADAFITAGRGIMMAALFADCVPLYFIDPAHEAVGLAHAGWKGTAQEIARRTVEAMGQTFGTKPADLHAAIGPSIGACCYEVDDRVTGSITAQTALHGEPFFRPSSVNAGKFMLNLQEINRKIMIEAGILPQRIEMTSLCTSCAVSRFFSHRKENGRTGRMAAWIGWV